MTSVRLDDTIKRELSALHEEAFRLPALECQLAEPHRFACSHAAPGYTARVDGALLTPEAAAIRSELRFLGPAEPHALCHIVFEAKLIRFVPPANPR